MTLILTEKPSVAADFAKALAASRINGYYEASAYIITNCIGHLLELYEPEQYNPIYDKWDLSTLPIIPRKYKYKENDKTKAQLAIIKTLLNKMKYENVIIATDAGREGELIGRLVLEHCHNTNHVLRFWSSAALTEEVIKHGMNNLKNDSEYDALYYSGLYRQRSDWLVGMNLSRLFTLRFNSLFSFGRVQTAMVKLIVDRYKEINQFVESYYFRLKAVCSFSGMPLPAYLLNKDETIDFELKDQLISISKSINTRQSITVVSINKTNHIINPPQLFNLVNLQKVANKKYGFSAEKTLNIAQALYETHKCLSYPRTPSRVLSNSNFDLFNSKISLFKGIYPEMFKSSQAINTQNKQIFDDTKLEDHHALIALSNIPQNATEEERKIFLLVVESMATVLKPSYKYEECSIVFNSNDLLFRTKSRTIIEMGWKEYQEDKEDEKSNKDDDIIDYALPALKIGQIGSIDKTQIEEKKRTPPKVFTEASLLSAMEKYNLGTEATRASIIETILKREYCRRNKKIIEATDKGVYFINSLESLDVERLSKFITVKESAVWEELLANNPSKFYDEISIFIENLVTVVAQKEISSFKGSILAICPRCGGDIRITLSSYSCSNIEAKKCTLSIPKTISSHRISEKEIKTILSGKSTSIIDFVSHKTQKMFKASLKLSTEPGKNIDFIFQETHQTGARR